jgi:dTDP-4-dehydrorhamnose reductase
MSWLVVGSSGQLGQAVSNQLDKHGIEYVLSNSSELDLAKLSSVNNLVRDIKPSVIINCAAYTNVDKAEEERELAWAINAEGARQLAEVAREVESLFVHVSTDYVFSGLSKTPYRENDLASPQGVYGESKAAGEQFVLETYESGSYIFRTAWLYSASANNFAKTMVKLALKDSEVVLVVEDQIGQPTFAGDLAKQIINSVASKIPFGIYHATNSGQASWFEFAKEIFHLVGAEPNRVKPINSLEYPRPAKRPTYSVLGHDKWIGSGLSEMRDWKIALREAIPAIIASVKAEQ